MKLWLSLAAGFVILAVWAGCASAPVGPFQYSPDEKKIKDYSRVGKALKTRMNDLEVTAEPLTMTGLSRVLNPGEKAKEVGYLDSAQDRISNTMVFYVTFDNQSKGQVLFNSTKTRLIYERKNWYKVNTTETLNPLDPADFYVILSKVKGAKERLELISSNIFHGTILLSPGQKRSGLIFFSWKEKDEKVINFQLSIPGVFAGIEALDFSFNFKVEPVVAAAPASSPKK